MKKSFLKGTASLLLICCILAGGCGSDAPKDPCELHCRCLCSSKSSPLYPSDIRDLMCQLCAPEKVCEGMDPEDCKELCRLSYETYVAEEVCDPVGGSEKGAVTKDDTTATEVLDLVADEAEAWGAGAFAVQLTCMNFLQDGSCHGWEIVYRAPDVEKAAHIYAVKGLAASVYESRSYSLNTPLADGWLDSDDIASPAWMHRPDQVDLTAASLVTGDPQTWRIIFWHMEGNDRIGNVGVQINALTGEVM